MDNNKVSVKLGNTVYSWDSQVDGWNNVTATYPYIGGTLQTEFEYEESPIGNPIETGGYLIFHNMIYALAKFDLSPETPIYATPLYPTDRYIEPSLPIYLDAYNEASTLYTDDTWEHRLQEMPHNGDSFYIIENGSLVLVSNAVIYPTATAGSTATDVPPAVIHHEWQRYRNGTLLPFKPVTLTNGAGGKPLAYDTVSDSIKPTNELTVENLTVTDTASINHATIVTEEDIHSEDDFIELRVNNPLPTPSTGSGFRVKNYDGNNHDLELVTDSSGTFRIGGGNLSMQPLLTRDEAAQMVNGAPLVWNATANKAQTTSTTDGNKVLKSVKNSQTGVVSYEWSSSGSGAVWRGTQAQLTAALLITDPNDEAYIPNNAMIIITDSPDSFLIGEEVN